MSWDRNFSATVLQTCNWNNITILRCGYMPMSTYLNFYNPVQKNGLSSDGGTRNRKRPLAD